MRVQYRSHLEQLEVAFQLWSNYSLWKIEPVRTSRLFVILMQVSNCLGDELVLVRSILQSE
jgi:hypothetical protein